MMTEIDGKEAAEGMTGTGTDDVEMTTIEGTGTEKGGAAVAETETEIIDERQQHFVGEEGGQALMVVVAASD